MLVVTSKLFLVTRASPPFCVENIYCCYFRWRTCYVQCDVCSSFVSVVFL